MKKIICDLQYFWISDVYKPKKFGCLVSVTASWLIWLCQIRGGSCCLWETLKYREIFCLSDMELFWCFLRREVNIFALTMCLHSGEGFPFLVLKGRIPDIGFSIVWLRKLAMVFSLCFRKIIGLGTFLSELGSSRYFIYFISDPKDSFVGEVGNWEDSFKWRRPCIFLAWVGFDI